MGYKYDIFVSYKWGSDLKVWVDNIFIPLLKDVLFDEMNGDNEDVFHDAEQNLPGGNIPLILRKGVARSKCMVCVLSPSFFNRSYWCPSELSAMLKRQDEINALNGSYVSLVFPVIFVDSKKKKLTDKSTIYENPEVHDLLTTIQPLELDRFKYFRTSPGFASSDARDDLREEITQWVKFSIKGSLQSAPAWDSNWDNPMHFVSRFQPPTAPPRFNLPQL